MQTKGENTAGKSLDVCLNAIFALQCIHSATTQNFNKMFWLFMIETFLEHSDVEHRELNRKAVLRAVVGRWAEWMKLTHDDV